MLSSAEFALNATIHAAHGKTPFFVVFGFEPSLPLDRAIEDIHDCKVHAVAKLVHERHKLHHAARTSLERANEAMARSANKCWRHVEFQVG